CYQYDSGCSF
nr:immunoglobulin light chain junction region [Macaca mulatta]